MSQIIRRTLNTQCKVIDPIKGIVEYVASDESIDFCGEVIRAAGWKFDRFQKNAPFVDSHNYSSIGCVLGKVIDAKVVGKQLRETVQWANDPALGNLLAQRGFAMTQAGLLPAVSVGFIPLKTIKRYDPSGAWDEAVDELDLGMVESEIACIYWDQNQLELSAVALGSNPNAVAVKSAYQAGILDGADLLRWPSFRRAFDSLAENTRRTYSFAPIPTQPMSKKSFAQKITDDLGAISYPVIKQASDNLESARRGQSETELFRACAAMRHAEARQRGVTAQQRASEILSDPLINEFLNVLPRYLAKVTPLNGPLNFGLVQRSLTPGSGTFGGTLLPIEVALRIWDMILLNGIWREFGVVSVSSMETKVVQATANPSAIWIPPSLMGSTTIPKDASLSGNNLTPEVNTIAAQVPTSRELLEDSKANLAIYLLTRFSEAISGVIDYASLQGNGAVDTTNGGITGIWNDVTIPTVNADAGNNAITQLVRADFLKAVAAVSGAALQRECKWIISPSFIAPLMNLVDGQGKNYLLDTPSQTGDGTWRLVGFEVVWAAQAPTAQTPGSVIAAFGHLPSYLVVIREELEVMLRDGSDGFPCNEQTFRAIARAFAQTRAASGLAKLALAAN